MKIHIPEYDQSKTGGGWTQTAYLYSGLGCVSYEEADVYLITGATMVAYDQVEKAKNDGKKVVLRVDNHLLPSRNRNTGMSRMKAFANQSDLIIYQSQWARNYLSKIIGKDGVVILNGVDTNIFYPGLNDSDCLYIRSSRINEKGWERARYWYSQNTDKGNLTIIGKFSRENLEYNFDFINNERFTFLGEQPRQYIANVMRSHKYFLYSYFMDACSNTLLEAKASGMTIVDVYGDLQTGGAPEIMNCKDITLTRMINEYKQALASL